jgi:hypothetical protein|tara:strand:+ start:1408 stop:1848 length:441 start_codon:yes stop_codon:yes gene_type:complete
MSSHQDYARDRVRDALKEAKGNVPQAQRLLLAWMDFDELLLRAIAEPHLRSIAGYALQSQLFDEAEEQHAVQANSPVPDVPKPVKKQAAVVEEEAAGAFGLALLQNVTGGARAQQFGFVTDEMDAPQKTSARHIEAILQLAGKEQK